MKRFRYRLQRVLDYRLVLKREKERELALRNKDLFEAEQDLEQILAAQDAAKPVSEQIVSMAELKLTGDYQQHLRKALEQQRELVEQATLAVDKAVKAYIEKAVEAETLETLKQKRKEEHREEAHKEEKKDLDELVIQRHGMKKRSTKGGAA